MVHRTDESEWVKPFIACLLSRELKEKGVTALGYSHASEFVPHRGCWFIHHGEQENCFVHEVQHIIAHDDSHDAVYV